MSKHLNLKSPIFKILLIFLVWRILLIVVSLLAIQFVPLGYKDRFLGGGPTNFAVAPWLFSWANFDGEHYLSIAVFGYKNLEQAFFPIYPLLISFFARPDYLNLITSLVNSTIIGLIISNIAFVLSLIFLWELIKIDYSSKIAYLTIIFLLIFPTSFYFGAVYNESLFLLLSVLTFYCARKGKWFRAGILGMLASATRVFGIILLPALLIEAWGQKGKFSRIFWIFLILLGIGSYMWYLNITVGDPIAFYSFQKLVGEQHQAGFISLPQVYFRYIKMILFSQVNPFMFTTILLEFLIGIVFVILPIYGFFKKIRKSYLFYSLVGFLLPTIQGSFSSSPRYVLILFPSFLALVLFFSQLPRIFKIILIVSLTLLMIFETTLFLRGYWVA